MEDTESMNSNVTRPFVSGAAGADDDSVTAISDENECSSDPTISASDNTYCSSVNRLCLNFTKDSVDDSPSRLIKCESFWRFVDTQPDLEKIRAAGIKGTYVILETSPGGLSSFMIMQTVTEEAEEAGEERGVEPFESTTEVCHHSKAKHAKFPWLHMLMKLKGRRLDQTALAGCKEKSDGCDGLLPAVSPTSEENAREAMAAIDQFEEDWAKRPKKTESQAFQLIKKDTAPKTEV